MRAIYQTSVLAAGLVALAVGADAGVIVSPTAVVQNTGGDFNSDYDIGNTIDRSGLSAGFTSGVTDFDTYIGSGPTHTSAAVNNEWFTPAGVTASTIVFDLGGVYSIARLALWNEEFSGILSLVVSTSLDAAFTTPAAVGAFAPTNSPTGLDYPAQVFGLSPSVGRYVRFVVTGPQVPNDGHNGIGMGEVAFDVTAVTPAVPEPGTLALLVTGAIGAVGGAVRKRRKALV